MYTYTYVAIITAIIVGAIILLAGFTKIEPSIESQFYLDHADLTRRIRKARSKMELDRLSGLADDYFSYYQHKVEHSKLNSAYKLLLEDIDNKNRRL